jgi:hypothetical protein
VAAITRTSTFTGSVSTHRPHLAALQHTQQAGLHAGGQLAHLVEQQRAAVGLAEQTGALARGAGERAAGVAEQLGLGQLAARARRS